MSPLRPKPPSNPPPEWLLSSQAAKRARTAEPPEPPAKRCPASQEQELDVWALLAKPVPPWPTKPTRGSVAKQVGLQPPAKACPTRRSQPPGASEPESHGQQEAICPSQAQPQLQSERPELHGQLQAICPMSQAQPQASQAQQPWASQAQEPKASQAQPQLKSERPEPHGQPEAIFPMSQAQPQASQAQQPVASQAQEPKASHAQNIGQPEPEASCVRALRVLAELEASEQEASHRQKLPEPKPQPSPARAGGQLCLQPETQAQPDPQAQPAELPFDQSNPLPPPCPPSKVKLSNKWSVTFWGTRFQGLV